MDKEFQFCKLKKWQRSVVQQCAFSQHCTIHLKTFKKVNLCHGLFTTILLIKKYGPITMLSPRATTLNKMIGGTEVDKKAGRGSGVENRSRWECRSHFKQNSWNRGTGLGKTEPGVLSLLYTRTKAKEPNPGEMCRLCYSKVFIHRYLGTFDLFYIGKCHTQICIL